MASNKGDIFMQTQRSTMRRRQEARADEDAAMEVGSLGQEVYSIMQAR